jgi:hypothetical protein
MGPNMKCCGKTKKPENNATLLRGELHATSTFIAARKRVQQHCTCIIPNTTQNYCGRKAITNMMYLKLEWPSKSNGFSAPCTKRDYKIITPHKTNPNPTENG